VANLILGASYN